MAGDQFAHLPTAYREMVPEYVNFTVECIDKHVHAGRGSRPALYDVENGTVLTYQELYELTNRVGNVLRQLGLRKGDHLVMRTTYTVDTVAVFFGAMKVGVVPVPTSVLLGARELERILDNSDAVLAVADDAIAAALEDAVAARGDQVKHFIRIGGEAKAGQKSYADLIAAASPECEPEKTGRYDPSFILYTSGSTGEPKGVERPHQMIIGAGEPNAYALMQLEPEDICLHPTQDLSFSYPVGHGLIFPLYAGASVLVTSARRGTRFDPELVFEYIEKFRVTKVSMVTSAFRRLLDVKDAEKRWDLSSVKLYTCAAEPLPAETYREWLRRFGLPLYETMGQSETPSFIGNYPGMTPKPGCLGKPFPGIPVTVLDDNLNECAVNEVGALVIRADYPSLFLGYRKMPEKTKEVVHDGWYFTQDQVYRDEDGYFWWVARSDEMIKSRGYKVAPFEVEEAILEHEAVQDVGVIGVPDEIKGQSLRAYVVLRPGYEASDDLAQDIRQHVRNTIAPYKVPDVVQFMDDLPKTTTGKIKRRALSEMYEKEQGNIA